MLGTPEQEAEIMAQVLSFRNDPVGFVHYAYPWGRPNTVFEKLRGPRRWQLEELEAIAEHIQNQEFAYANDLPLQIWKSEYSSGRGPGKTAVFGMAAHWHMSTHIGSTVTVTANTENQMKTKTFPEFAVWFGSAINAHWFALESLRIVPAPWILELVRKLPEEGGMGIDPKYWFVQGQTWNEDNPSAFAGTHNPLGLMLLMDEASGIHSGVWDTAEGFFTEVNPYRLWMAASQMRFRKGRFYEIMHERERFRDWRVRTLSTRGMEGIDQSLIANQIRTYGEDSDFVRVEIDGLPPRTSEDQFIAWDAVRAAQNNTILNDYGEPLILGVDPAPRGKTSWRFRQGRNGRDCVGRDTHGHWMNHDNVQIADRILALDAKYNPDAICIDFGMGTGVIDVLRRHAHIRRKLHEVKFGGAVMDKDSEWATHSIELWGRLREWLPGGQIEKDAGEKGSLSEQMTNRGWKWSGREDGKKILETKETMKERGVDSPDDVDALACTFEVNLPRVDRLPRSGRPAGLQVADGVMKSAFFD